MSELSELNMKFEKIQKDITSANAPKRKRPLRSDKHPQGFDLKAAYETMIGAYIRMRPKRKEDKTIRNLRGDKDE